jgi:sec-independent protein translocase protein TatA
MDLLVVAVVALLFFGPKRLPEMGSAIGRTIKEFQKSMREVTHPSEAPPQLTLPAVSQSMQVLPQAPQLGAGIPDLGREALQPQSPVVTTEHTSD